MKDSTERTIPQAIGDLIQELERHGRAYEEAFASFRQARQQVLTLEQKMVALDVQARLATAAVALSTPEEEQGAEPALSPDQLSGALARLGDGLVEAVNQRASALAVASAGAVEQRRAEVSRFRTNQYEPFRTTMEQVAPLFKILGYQGGTDGFRHVLDRYADILSSLERFTEHLKGFEEGPSRPWDGTVEIDLPDPSEWLEIRSIGETSVPQIRAEVMANLTAEINRSIKYALEEHNRPRARESDAAAKLGKIFLPLLDKTFDLWHSIRELEAGETGAQQVQEITKALTTLLKAHEIDEIDATPGRTCLPRYHKIVTHESKAGFDSGQIIRVVSPGYHLGDQVGRPAQVVVAR